MSPRAPALSDPRPVLVTGAAGFIGYHVAEALLARGERVVGVDNMNAYYDPRLKEERLARLSASPGFEFVRLDLAEPAPTAALFAACRPQRVIHLAAQAGVRWSVSHPEDFVTANLVAFLQVLEGCRAVGVQHLVYASSSSVYGDQARQPLHEGSGADHPLSLYAATKRCNELMAHSYAHLFGLPSTGLRYFSVYGPYGRPDMAVYLFAEAMRAGRPIQLFNHGDMVRDFTYVDDVVAGTLAALDHPPAAGPAPEDDDPARSAAPFRVYNLGGGSPRPLVDLVDALERALGVTAIRELVGPQPADVRETRADVSRLADAVGYAPSVPLEEGVRRFAAWYLGRSGR
ncbi:NAD-dependent epimerase/dehydratase family protein [Myxococcota bacterium]|nr:NAD-dependent epimerase/dehydratase family protein [Myxococcota bacterium]